MRCIKTVNDFMSEQNNKNKKNISDKEKLKIVYMTALSKCSTPETEDLCSVEWLTVEDMGLQEIIEEENWVPHVVNPLFILHFWEDFKMDNEQVKKWTASPIKKWNWDLFAALRRGGLQYKSLFEACLQFANLRRYLDIPHMHAGRFVVEDYEDYLLYLEQVKHLLNIYSTFMQHILYI